MTKFSDKDSLQKKTERGTEKDKTLSDLITACLNLVNKSKRIHVWKKDGVFYVIDGYTNIFALNACFSDMLYFLVFPGSAVSYQITYEENNVNSHNIRKLKGVCEVKATEFEKINKVRGEFEKQQKLNANVTLIQRYM